MSQHSFFIDDSLRRNVVLGLSDEDSDEARIARAVALAQLADFVAGLPKYNYLLQNSPTDSDRFWAFRAKSVKAADMQPSLEKAS